MKNEISQIHDDILVQLATDPIFTSQFSAGMLQTISEVIAKTLDAERISIWKIDDENSKIEAQNIFDRINGLHEDSGDFPLTNLLEFVKVIQRHRFINIFNTQEDERLNYLSDSEWGLHGVKSLLIVPIRSKGIITGILRIDQMRSRRIWMEEEIHFACQVADLIAIGNMQFEMMEMNKKLDYIVSLAHEIETDPNFDSLCQKFSECLAKVLNADSSLIYKVDNNQKSLSLVFSFNLPEGYVHEQLKFGEEAAGQVAQKNKIVEMNNPQEFDLKNGNFDNLSFFPTVIAVPVSRNNQPLYVLEVLRKKSSKSFEVLDRRILDQMVAWFGLLVDQKNYGTRLDLLRDYQNAFKTLLDSSDYISNVPELLNSIIDFCLPLFHAKYAILNCFQWGATRSLPEERHIEINALFTTNQTEISWRKGSIVVDKMNESKNLNQDFVSLLKISGIRSFVLTPLLFEEQRIGFFFVGNEMPVKWDDDQIQMMEILAKQVAMLVKKLSTSTENIQREILNWRINTLGQRLSQALTYAEAIQVVGNMAVELMVPSKVIMLLRRPSKSIESVFLYNLQDWSIQSILEKHVSVFENHFFAQSIPDIIPDILKEELPDDVLDYFSKLNCVSIKILPLNFQDQPVAVILALYGDEVKWPQYERETLRIFAQTAVLAIQNAWMYEELEKGYLDVAMALSNEINVRESSIQGMSSRMANWAEKIARTLGCSEAEIDDIRWAALLHGIGKSGIPNKVLGKPGPLTDEERDILQKTPEEGENYIRPLSRFRNVGKIIRNSRERFDGDGYPDRLKGQEIPLGARVLAVVELYASMIVSRPYRLEMQPEQALQELISNRGTQFDPQVIDAFINSFNWISQLET